MKALGTTMPQLNVLKAKASLKGYKADKDILDKQYKAKYIYMHGCVQIGCSFNEAPSIVMCALLWRRAFMYI